MCSVEQAVGILHADDARRQRPPQDVERHVADSDRADLALVAQRDHLGKLVVEVDDLISLGGQTGPEVEAAQIDHRDAVQAELAQIVFDRGAQLGRLLGGRKRYRAVGDVCGADLADDDEIVAVGRQSLADTAVDLAARVEGRGVDVVDPEFHGAA